MSDSLKDGLYTIISDAYSDTLQAADLIDANAYGPISGYQQGASNNQGWNLTHTPDGNFINLESNAVPGSFAFVWKETNGAPLSANATATNWSVTPVVGTNGSYQISNADGSLFWVLERPNNYYTIELRSAADVQGTTAQWTFALQ